MEHGLVGSFGSFVLFGCVDDLTHKVFSDEVQIIFSTIEHLALGLGHTILGFGSFVSWTDTRDLRDIVDKRLLVSDLLVSGACRQSLQRDA